MPLSHGEREGVSEGFVDRLFDEPESRADVDASLRPEELRAPVVAGGTRRRSPVRRVGAATGGSTATCRHWWNYLPLLDTVCLLALPIPTRWRTPG